MGANATPSAVRRPESPLGGKPDPRDSHHTREIPTTRRIGSGRILTRDRDSERPAGGGTWEFERGRPDKENEFNSFRGLRERDRERDRDRDERYERRSFGREFERSDKERRGGSRSFGSDRNDRRRNDRDDEPEWFSGGPTSQHDTIELHGFDEPSDNSGRKMKKSPPKITKTNGKFFPENQRLSFFSVNKEDKKEDSPPSEEKKDRPKETIRKITLKPTTEDRCDEKDDDTSKSKSDSDGKQQSEPMVTNDASGNSDFNLEDFLKLDHDFSDFSDLLTSNMPVFPPPQEAQAKEVSNTTTTSSNAGSRFQQWFQRQSPPNSGQPNNEDSRRSSLQDEILIGSIMKNLEPTVSIPALGSSEAYFAPISPAASGSSGPGVAPTQSGLPGHVEHSGPSASLLEMLHRSQQPQDKNPSIKDLEAAGRLHSVEELEAKMRQQNLNVRGSGGNQPCGDEQQAFQKLVNFNLALVELMKVSQGPSDSNGATQPQNFVQVLGKGVHPEQRIGQQHPQVSAPNTGNNMEQGMFSGGGGGFNPVPPANSGGASQAQMNIPQDLVLKLLQIQQQQQQQQRQHQRRSFNTGCFVSGTLAAGCGMGANATPSAVRRPESPLGGKPDPRDSHHTREIPTTRRIGSGRILTRDRDSERPAGGGTWEFERGRPDKENEFNSFRGLRERDRERDRDRDERYERRSFGREFERSDKERRGGSRSFGSDRNDRRRNDRDDEPEWFSGGPTSQHDTIELHGFDEPSDNSGRKMKKSPPKITKTNGKFFPENQRLSFFSVNKEDKKEDSPPSEEKKDRPKETIRKITLKPTTEDRCDEKDDDTSKSKSDSDGKQQSEPMVTNDASGNSDFNLEDFLKLDHDFSDFSDLLTSNMPVFPPPQEAQAKEVSNTTTTSSNAGSRFQQWFQRQSPPNSGQPNNEDSRRSSLQDEILIGSIMKNLEPTVSIPALGSSEAYFAPISPAASGSSGPGVAPTQSGLPGHVEHSGPSASLLEMLHRSQQPQDKNPSIKDLEAAGRLHSVEELEAKMRQQNLNVRGSGGNQPCGDEQQAFQKLVNFNLALVELMKVSQGPSDSNGATQPQNFVQVLGKGVHPEQRIGQQHPQVSAPNTGNNMEQGMFSGGGGGFNPQHQQQHQQQQQQHQQQQDALNKLLGGPQPPTQIRAATYGGPNPLSPLPPEVQMLVNQAQPSRELLQRPEAQNIIKGLKRGELTMQNLVHQLHNTGMQPRHREVLASIVKLQQQQTQQQQQQQLHQPPPLSPRATSPHPDVMHQLMVQQQQQQQMRITSPLNGALCPTPVGAVLAPSPVPPLGATNASLAVQHSGETLGQAHSPNVGVQKAPPSSSSPLAFTPTSVLRKMTAEKDFESGMSENKGPLQQLQSQANMMLPLGGGMGQGPVGAMQPQQHSNWKPIEPVMPKPHQGRPIVKGNQQQGLPPQVSPQQGGYYQGDMGRHGMMGMPPNNPQQLGMRGPQAMSAPDNGNSGVLLQQLLMGQRSINSFTSRPGRALRPQTLQQQHGGHELSGGGSHASLSQWFTGAGQMGSMPPIPTANTLSLEEIERRQQASAVHN
ncbi:hypothetical protein B566_EDAN015280 [Ephemera danica]|nr:hypothetical protein B566_EDAN015280 [Ephemera danica]